MNLPFVNPEYIIDTSSKIRFEINNDYFLKLLDYFLKEKKYLKNYKNWKYYNNMEHITNIINNSLDNYLDNLSYYFTIFKSNFK